MRARLWLCLVLAVFATVIFLAVYRSYFAIPQDQVVVNNTTGMSAGILVVGDGSPPLVYRSFNSLTSSFGLGNVLPSMHNNEVVAFTNQRAVAIANPVPWTSGSDTVTVPLSGPIGIDVTVWVVNGSYSAQHDRLMAMSLAASTMWNDERMGVVFNSFDFHDATMQPSAPLYSNFTCTMKTSMQSTIGKVANRINVYMVDLVQGSIGRGQTCGIGTDFVAIASDGGDALLAHEIGHDFGLEHIDMLIADFDQTNVMHSASDVRQYFTEGQLFRAHMGPLSALNATYPARPGQPTRACPQSTSDTYCPPIAKRIWADGTYPSN